MYRMFNELFYAIIPTLLPYFLLISYPYILLYFKCCLVLYYRFWQELQFLESIG